MNVRSRSSPIILSSLAEARHPAGIREALFVIRFGVIARSGIRRATASGSSAERRKACYKSYKACKRTRFWRGLTKWANEVCGCFVSIPVLPRVCTFAQAH